MKNLFVENQKQNNFSIVTIISLTIVFMLLSIFTPVSSYCQYVKNGSFEHHFRDTAVPYGLCPSYIEGVAGYKDNELIRCIGFCHDNNGWPPYNYPGGGYCDYNIFNPPTYDGGWYYGSNAGSVDFYHIAGHDAAKSPYVNAHVFEYGEARKEYRWPYGYTRDYSEHHDSAFVGFAFIAKHPRAGQTFTSSKEYLQSKLQYTLTGPATYTVKFHVSASLYNTVAIKSICALFTYGPVVNPTDYREIYERNLSSTNSPDTYHYIDYPQMCSDVYLNQRADAEGYGGWQEVSGSFYVPENVEYNYITIGNFQSDSNLWREIRPVIAKSDTVSQKKFYYFVDSISVTADIPTTCRCRKDMFIFKAEKQIQSTDTSKCCYNYSLYLPQDANIPTAPFCHVAKYTITHGQSDIVFDTTAANGTIFNGQTLRGSFCVNKFHTNDSLFTLKYFERDGQNFNLLDTCTNHFTLKCLCDCSDLADSQYENNKLRFNLVKVDSSASGRCCWDIVMVNPNPTDSSSCQYDLSNKYLLLSLSPGDTIYKGSSGLFTYTKVGNMIRWQAPGNFSISPGQVITVGQICSQVPPPSPYIQGERTFDFVLSNTASIAGKCDIVMSEKLTCDSIINPSDTSCCDYWTLKMDNIATWTVVHSQTLPNGYVYQTANLNLHHKNTPKFCDNNDTLIFNMTANGRNDSERGEFTLKDVTSGAINISELLFLSSDDSLVVCVNIKNKRTLDSCVKCKTYLFPLTPESLVKKDNDEFQKSSQYYIDHPDEFFDIIPNPAENKFDVIFRYNMAESGTATLNDNLGNLMITNNFNTQNGINKITFDNINFSSGMYFINLNINGKLYSKKVMILK